MIGISGVATSGKDTLFSLLNKRLIEKNISATRFALADSLKYDLHAFIKMLFNIDIYFMTPEEKEFIRPIMVIYGKYKRKSSNGRYWIEKLALEITKSKSALPIITDIRYCEYNKDEVFWLKNEMNGVLVHVSRYSNGNLLLPANEEELKNDKKILNYADFKIAWNTEPDKEFLYKKHLSDLDEIIKLYESKKYKL